VEITLQEWLEVDRLARQAEAAMKALSARLDEVAIGHMADREVVEFASRVQERMADGLYVARALRLQPEWLGGDSSQARNHGLREPDILRIAGRIPRAIAGSAGVDRLA
jgi:predicted nucleic acid-binding protein